SCACEDLSAVRFAEYLSLGQVPDAPASNDAPPAVSEADRWVPPDEDLFPAMLLREPDPDNAPSSDEAPDDPPEGDVAPAAADAGPDKRSPRQWEQILI